MTLFGEITIALILASALGIFFYLLRQPTIIGFILAGIAISYFGYLSTEGRFEIINVLSSIGVALLLFIVGLEMSFKELKDVGKQSIIIAFAQAIITFSVGYFIATLLGFSVIVSIYIGIALTFSSTIILVKLISEKNELKSLYGRIALGSSLIQDLMAVIILILLAGLSDGVSALTSASAVIKGLFFVFLAILSSKILPRFLDFIGTSPELLYLFSLSWAIGWAAFLSSPIIGLSIEIGGFLAGLSLANSSEHFQIGARLKPLRDFFLIIFFIGLGAKML
ncbi:MAG TPA: cation:proton antiporter, partial [Candidatus Paceibacterota bacterium]